MPNFTFTVIETRTVEVEYWIEADSRHAAIVKAETGDTVGEIERAMIGVTGRYVVADPGLENGA